MSKALSSRSFKIDTRFYLTEHVVNNTTKKKVVAKPTPVNHVYCCDISGSMYDSLPPMRKQLKNRISSVIGDQDTITIIAFAGRNQCFVLKEMVHCNTPTELKMLHDAIDKFLKPMGCTDFVNPIVETKKIFASDTKNLWNWVFLSDGGHNESSFDNVIDALEEIKSQVGSASIIEYGLYADSDRLSQMAAILGGTKIQAEDFDSYVPVFEKALKRRNMSKNIAYELDKEVLDNRKLPQLFYLDPASETIHVLIPDTKNKVYLPEEIKTFYSISSKVVGDNSKKPMDDTSALYGAASICADRLQYGMVEKILATIGDKKFIQMYSVAFGKSRLFSFQQEVTLATFHAESRGEIDPNYQAPDNTYCIVDLVDDLKNGNNEICVCSPDFTYKRTSAKTVDKIELTEEEKELLAKAKTAAQIEKITKGAEERKVKMTMVDKGYSIDNFTWNETRANLSARFQIDVKLELPQNEFKIKEVESSVWRNYTLIKDGIVNVDIVPVILDEATFKKISNSAVKMEAVKKTEDNRMLCKIDFRSVPVLNRNKVYASKKTTMTKLSLELEEYKFELKYLGYLKKKLGIVDKELIKDSKLSEKAKEYLATLGITAKGYNPAKEAVKSEDFYMCTEFVTKIAGFSKIPAVEDIDKKLKKKQSLTAAETFLQEVMAFIDRKYLSKAKGDAYKAAVESAFNAITIKKKAVAQKLSTMKFAMLVAKKWFFDCESFDDNTDKIDSSFGQTLEFTYEFKESKQEL